MSDRHQIGTAKVQADSGPTEQEVLQGFTRVNVVHRKNRMNEVVDVAILPVSKLQQYAALQGDPAKSAELLTGKKPGWADLLQNESVFLVAEEGFRVNSSGFFALGNHHKKVIAMMQGRAEVSTSPDSLPESASSPG